MKSLSKTFAFSKKYFLSALILFCIEIFIARYVRDQIIRPYGGDFLVVILLYCILRSFTHLSVNTTCISVLLFSYLIEILQHFHLAVILGFRSGSIPYILLGNYFSWADIISYTLGIAAVFSFERYFVGSGTKNSNLKNLMEAKKWSRESSEG